VEQVEHDVGRAVGQQNLIRRVSLVAPLAYVVKTSPDLVPYWRGETYWPLFTSWIPRFMWADKPEERTGFAFGLRYRMLGPTEYNMSMNIPWITEAYANFGTLGIVFGMVLIGAFLGLLETIFNRPGASVAEFAAGSAILAPLWFQESNLSLMTGSILPVAIFFWLYLTCGSYLLKRFAPMKST